MSLAVPSGLVYWCIGDTLAFVLRNKRFPLSLYWWLLGYISFCCCSLFMLFVRKISINKTCFNDILCESAAIIMK